MLAEATERVERCEAVRAAICSVLVPWTCEMAVEGVKRPESVVTEHTLVRKTIPRPICGDIPTVVATVGKESRRNGDNIIRIIEPDPSVDHGAIGTGRARSRLEVEYHRRLADKPLRATTVLECTRYVPGTMHAGIHVLRQGLISCGGN